MGKCDGNQVGYARCSLRRPFGRSNAVSGCDRKQETLNNGNGCSCNRCSGIRPGYGGGQSVRPGCGGEETVRLGCGCGESRREERVDHRRCNTRACGELMTRLQKVDFSLQETVLYLDAYPDCCQARQYYQQLLDERRRLVAEYEESCGPLTSMGNVSESSWDWTAAPWPWQPDFPGNKQV